MRPALIGVLTVLALVGSIRCASIGIEEELIADKEGIDANAVKESEAVVETIVNSKLAPVVHEEQFIKVEIIHDPVEEEIIQDEASRFSGLVAIADEERGDFDLKKEIIKDVANAFKSKIDAVSTNLQETKDKFNDKIEQVYKGIKDKKQEIDNNLDKVKKDLIDRKQEIDKDLLEKKEKFKERVGAVKNKLDEKKDFIKQGLKEKKDKLNELVDKYIFSISEAPETTEAPATTTEENSTPQSTTTEVTEPDATEEADPGKSLLKDAGETAEGDVKQTNVFAQLFQGISQNIQTFFTPPAAAPTPAVEPAQDDVADEQEIDAENAPAEENEVEGETAEKPKPKPPSPSQPPFNVVQQVGQFVQSNIQNGLNTLQSVINPQQQPAKPPGDEAAPPQPPNIAAQVGQFIQSGIQSAQTNLQNFQTGIQTGIQNVLRPPVQSEGDAAPPQTNIVQQLVQNVQTGLQQAINPTPPTGDQPQRPNLIQSFNDAFVKPVQTLVQNSVQSVTNAINPKPERETSGVGVQEAKPVKKPVQKPIKEPAEAPEEVVEEEAVDKPVQEVEEEEISQPEAPEVEEISAALGQPEAEETVAVVADVSELDRAAAAA